MNTLSYAQSELNRLWHRLTGENENECSIKLINEDYGNKFDDVAYIEVKKGQGLIRGSNARAVLLGVYRLFYRLGCRFIRPGTDGELIPFKKLSECSVTDKFIPDHRHRGVCNEGAISCENVVDMVRWIPKLGMNSYFMQFTDGHLFFEKWYRHLDSTVIKPEEYTVEHSKEHYKAVVEAVKECGLIYHAVGHGWTTEPLGYVTYGETRAKDEDIKGEHRELFAMIKGKRGFFNNTPSDTHLCYSNKIARDIITDAITNYLKENKQNVDILHFWLADSLNNHCECQNCTEKPSDYYAMMLNELDKKLAQNNIDTKIAFLIYCDLLWAPEKVEIENPDRFILMYAPIARNYFETLYTDYTIEASYTDKGPAFVKNKNDHPKSGPHYLSYLNDWLEKVKCDSFTFEYHLMTFVYGADLSFKTISKTIYEDMSGLHKAGINGNISCQLQRVFFPTSLPLYVMGERLVKYDRSFEEIEEEYMQSAFGKNKDSVQKFLNETEKFFSSYEVRLSKDLKQKNEFYTQYRNFLTDFKEKTVYTAKNKIERTSIDMIEELVEILLEVTRLLILKTEEKDIENEKAELYKKLDTKEFQYQSYLDMLFFKMGLNSWL